MGLDSVMKGRIAICGLYWPVPFQPMEGGGQGRSLKSKEYVDPSRMVDNSEGAKDVVRYE